MVKKKMQNSFIMLMKKHHFFEKNCCGIENKLYLCKSFRPRVILATGCKSGEVPEWSIGAVSKTVDQLAGPRVRIPASPLKEKDGSQNTCHPFCFFNGLFVLYFFR